MNLEEIIAGFAAKVVAPVAEVVANGLSGSGKDVEAAEICQILKGADAPPRKKLTRATIPSGAKSPMTATCVFEYTRATVKRKKGDICGAPCDESGFCKDHKGKKADAPKAPAKAPARVDVKNLQTGKFVPKPATAQDSQGEEEEGARKQQPINGAETSWPNVLRTPDGFLYRQNSEGEIIVYCTSETDGMRAALGDVDFAFLQKRGWKVAPPVIRAKAIADGIFEIPAIAAPPVGEAAEGQEVEQARRPKVAPQRRVSSQPEAAKKDEAK